NEARHRNHVSSEIGDPDRLAHVERTQLAIATKASEEHEADRFGNGHEVATAIRMCDGNRPAALDLLFEEWDHASGGTQYVAEADRREMRLRASRKITHHELGDAF